MFFSVWLIPSSKDFESLNKIIVQLSQAHKTLDFDPHVTVFSGSIDEDKMDLSTIVSGIAQQFKPIILNVNGVDAMDEYVKSLFLSFDSTEELKKLSQNIKTETGSNDDYNLLPHLSLLYSRMPLEEKRKLIPTVPSFSEITFNRVQAILIPERGNVQLWRPVFERPISLGFSGIPSYLPE